MEIDNPGAAPPRCEISGRFQARILFRFVGLALCLASALLCFPVRGTFLLGRMRSHTSWESPVRLREAAEFSRVETTGHLAAVDISSIHGPADTPRVSRDGLPYPYRRSNFHDPTDFMKTPPSAAVLSLLSSLYGVQVQRFVRNVQLPPRGATGATATFRGNTQVFFGEPVR